MARQGICLSTPNRWFPVEFNTQLPLVHWLSKPSSRALMRRLGYSFFAEEDNLNLMSRRQLAKAVAGIEWWKFEIATGKRHDLS